MTSNGLVLALRIVFAIGLHNLGKGLVIGVVGVANPSHQQEWHGSAHAGGRCLQLPHSGVRAEIAGIRGVEHSTETGPFWRNWRNP